MEKLQESTCIQEAEAVAPGFINLKLDREFLAGYLNQMSEDAHLGFETAKEPKTIIVDYGGANVAKPLHVGHLRSAIIGESIKRIGKFAGHHVIGDVHLGDCDIRWTCDHRAKKRKPELPYFDENPWWGISEEAPFTIGELEEIYPTASAYAKEHEDYKEEALQATFLLQNGHRGYHAVWKHIMNVSVSDLKKNYGNLNVDFDLWKGEADAQEYIPDMVEYMKKEGYAHIDNGALVVDVKEETDTKENPAMYDPKIRRCSAYDTTDLATLIERENYTSRTK